MRSTIGVFAALAGNTITELLRNKLLYVLLVFGLGLILSSIALASLTVGQWERVINDVGLATVELSSALVAILVGIGLVAGEVERRTAYVTLAKPVSRSRFVWGRFLGLAAMLLAIVSGMGATIQVVLVAFDYDVHATSVAAIGLIGVEACVMASLAVVFSAFTTPVLGTIYTLSLFVVGHLAGDLESYAQRLPAPLGPVLQAFAYVLPNLDLLDLKSEAANLVSVGGRHVASAAGYGVLYCMVALALAAAIFERRDLK